MVEEGAIVDYKTQYLGSNKESSYLVFTSGCPADHVSGFKNGGLKRMLSECRSW